VPTDLSDPADWDAAVAQLRALRDEVADEPDVAAEIACDLALVLFQRFHALLGGWDPRHATQECRALADDVDALGTEIPYVTMVRGLVRLDAYMLGEEPGDRDDAIALLGAALPDLDVEATLVAEAWGELALALDDGSEGDNEDRARRRDSAIDALCTALGVIPAAERPDLVLLDGQLRCSRGDDLRDAAELRRGVESITAFRSVADPDDADLPYAWVMEATAHERLRHITKDTAEEVAIVACCDSALAAGATEEMALEAHRMMIETLQQQLDGLDRAALMAARTRFDAAVLALDAYPEADAGIRAELACAVAGLGIGLVGAAPGLVDINGLQRFTELALRHPEPPPEWDTKLCLLSVVRLAPNYQEPPPGTPRLPEIAAAWPRSAFAEEFGPSFARVAGMMAFFDAFRSGDRARLRAARDLMSTSRDGDSAGDELMMALVEALIAFQDGATDEENIRAFERLVATAEKDSDDPWTAQYILPLFRALVAAMRGRAAPAVESVSVPGDALATFLDGRAGSFDAMGAVLAAERDPDRLRVQLLRDEERCRCLEPGSVPYIASMAALGVGYLQLARLMPADAGAVESAAHWCRAALESLPGPQHPLWHDRARDLGEACRIRRLPGDLPLSRAAGLSALRGHAWQALLQSGTDHAVAAARTAAASALVVAGWCAQDGAHEDLIQAVEAGRGLALHAATTTRSVATSLAGIGRDDLAVAWAEAGGADRLTLPGPGSGVDLYGDLRPRVMGALTAAAPTLLDPPELARVRAALMASAADALVYLVPGTGRDGGRAILLPAAGEIEVIELAGLVDGPGSVMAEYTAAYEACHLPGSEGPLDDAAAAWSAQLQRLVQWAWGAAAADVLTAARRISAGRLPRLVLVPVGMLGLVPWHAAVRPGGAGVRYLVEDAAISYAASAQLFCEVAERAPVVEGSAVIVGNPTNDLRAAGLEAQAVRAAFHPDATYLGRVGDGRRPADRAVASAGSGTPEEVLDLIVDPARPCAVLHLACHALADASAPSASHVLLADGLPLDVGALMERAPTEPLPLGTVVLAACSTNVAGARYDEAFSLSTAFLAAGARTAMGSLWTVPDGFTSRLVFMVYHFLHEGLRPVDAVRRAQLWMLDRNRTAPATMPDALRARIATTAYEHPANWAAVTHLGR
jgi:hypothetical protein